MTVAMLDARSLAHALGGEACGREAVVAPGPGHSRKDRSLSIRIDPQASGGFIVYSHAGDDPIRCRDYVRERCGLGPWGRQHDQPGSTPFAVSVTKDDVEGRRRFAARLWDQSVEPRGSVVERYLQGRGLCLADGVAGEAIRFHDALRYENRNVAGMVALLRNIITDEPTGIHRTFLERATGHKIDRRMLGSARQAAIKIDADECVIDRLTIGEGIETCLAARMAGLGPVWALGSAVGVRLFPIVPRLTELTILEENDPTSSDAVRQCAGRWLTAGRRVHVVTPKVGKDFNDVWRACQ